MYNMYNIYRDHWNTKVIERDHRVKIIDQNSEVTSENIKRLLWSQEPPGMARFQEPVPIWEPVILPQNQNRIGSGTVPNEPEYQLK